MRHGPQIAHLFIVRGRRQVRQQMQPLHQIVDLRRWLICEFRVVSQVLGLHDMTQQIDRLHDL